MADISPIRVYVGDDWLVQVALVDASNNPIDLTGATVGADFWPTSMAAPVDLLAAGGGITVVQIKPALVLLTVPRAVTGNVDQQSVLQRFWPTRAAIWVVDSLNHRQTVQLLPFQPLKARDTDLPSALAVMTNITAVLSPQGLSGPPGVQGQPGLPGPSPSVASIIAAAESAIGQSGGFAGQDALAAEVARAEAAEVAHAGRIDNPHAVTAHQVGAYTQAEVDAAIAAALAPLLAQISALKTQIAALASTAGTSAVLSPAFAAFGLMGANTSGSAASASTATPANTNALHPTFAAFGLVGASTA